MATLNQTSTTRCCEIRQLYLKDRRIIGRTPIKTPCAGRFEETSIFFCVFGYQRWERIHFQVFGVGAICEYSLDCSC